MYDKTSPNYHHWLTPAQYKAQFAPTAQDAATVRSYLADHHLTVSFIDQNNHFLVAKGRVGDAQRAFNTQINCIMVNGEVHRVSAPEASVMGPARAFVAAVQGLSDHRYSANVHLATRSRNGATLRRTCRHRRKS